jgi:hypothetical protein
MAYDPNPAPGVSARRRFSRCPRRGNPQRTSESRPKPAMFRRTFRPGRPRRLHKPPPLAGSLGYLRCRFGRDSETACRTALASSSECPDPPLSGSVHAGDCTQPTFSIAVVSASGFAHFGSWSNRRYVCLRCRAFTRILPASFLTLDGFSHSPEKWAIALSRMIAINLFAAVTNPVGTYRQVVALVGRFPLITCVNAHASAAHAFRRKRPAADEGDGSHMEWPDWTDRPFKDAGGRGFGAGG